MRLRRLGQAHPGPRSNKGSYTKTLCISQTARTARCWRSRRRSLTSTSCRPSPLGCSTSRTWCEGQACWRVACVCVHGISLCIGVLYVPQWLQLPASSAALSVACPSSSCCVVLSPLPCGTPRPHPPAVQHGAQQAAAADIQRTQGGQRGAQGGAGRGGRRAAAAWRPSRALPIASPEQRRAAHGLGARGRRRRIGTSAAGERGAVWTGRGSVPLLIMHRLGMRIKHPSHRLTAPAPRRFPVDR